MDDSLKILRVRDEEEEVTPPTRSKRRSFWCWLRRHHMLVGGYNYNFVDMSMTPVMVCQCNLADADIPSLKDQLNARRHDKF